MKMGATIECPPSPFDDISNDPLKETISGFGAKKSQTVEQRSENFTEGDIMRLIRNETNDIKVDLKNPIAAVDEIVEYLEKEQSIEVSEDIRKYIEIIGIGTKANYLRNKKRTENKGTIEMALADAKWMETVIEYIRENKNNPKKIEELWQQYDLSFLNFEEQSDEDFSGKYNSETTKRGILTEIAAMDLLEEMVNDFEGCEKVEIRYSTPEEDVHKKVDFFLAVTFENGEIVEIPVQVTSCNLSTPANNFSDEKKKTGIEIKEEREELNRKIEFVLNNAIHTVETVEDIEINSNYKYQKWLEDKMKKFFDENKNGIFMFIPYGEVLENKIALVEGENKRKECVYETGRPSRMVRDRFNKSPAVENIKTDLAQIAQ